MFRPCSRSFALLLVFLADFSGCSEKEPFRKADPNRLAITGAVSLNGQPLSGAMVSFEPVEKDKGLVASGATLYEGKFQIEAIDGLAPGTYRVKVYDLASYGVGVGGADGDAERPPKFTIPAQFNERSTRTIEVKAGVNNHFTLDLK